MVSQSGLTMASDAPYPSDDHTPQVEVDDAGRSTDVESESRGPEIHDPFDPEKIEVQTRNPTVSLILARIGRGTIDLAPDFQRHAEIWNPANQSRLIESLLLRIPLPSFYAAEGADDRWTIVDGIQRLTTIARFMRHESVQLEPLILKDLEYLEKYEGYRYEDLPGRLQTRLDETELVVHLIRRGTPEQVMFNIFARINTGGLPLSFQELRHALIPGPARKLLAELAASESFLRATSASVGRSRMADREMVLRFIAFLLHEPSTYDSQDFDNFLRMAMKEINSLPDASYNRIQLNFRRAMDAAHAIFGDHAFRKQRRDQTNRYPINKALFEAVSVNLAGRTDSMLQRLIAQRDQVNSGLIRLLTSVAFESAVSVGTGDVAKLKLRFAQVDKLFASHDGTA